MNEFFDDPRFPDRPSHPDFWHLSGVVLKFDGDAVAGTSTEDTVRPYIDPDSLLYMARQRAGMAVAQLRSDPNPDVEAMIAAAMINGFVIGAEYQRSNE